MRIVALYKIWRGNEFLIPSIHSIYNHVQKIVFVSSDLSWLGEQGNNTLETVKKWKQDSDRMDKIDILHYNTMSQHDQYQCGFDHINKNYSDCDWIQLIDSDEVWTEAAWFHSIKFMESTNKFNALHCVMVSYIKKINYTIEGNEVQPVVFVKPAKCNIGVRSCSVEPYAVIPDAVVHHFALVRKTPEEVFHKIKTNVAGEEVNTKLVNLDVWKKEVWDELPKGKCYHYFKGCDSTWLRFKEVAIESVPYTCRGII